jgi:hypothetical protein
MSLNNLSNRQSETGDRDAALASITEATGHYRQLAQASPATYLPDLAASLNNLSNRQSETGDRDAALASITQAVTIRRQLAQASPATYLPDLAASLNNLSNRVEEDGDGRGAVEQWHAAIEGLPFPAPRAELRTAWARRLTQSDTVAAHEQLRLAAAEADRGVEDNGPPERAALLVSRARLAVRELARMPGQPPPSDLPVWLQAPIDDTHLELINAYAQVDTWPGELAVLDPHRDTLRSAEFRTTLHALNGLYPADTTPTLLLALLDEIDATGIDQMYAARTTDYRRRDLLTRWISTTTWTESHAFLTTHHDELTTDESHAILADAEGDTARQHLAILELTTVWDVDTVFELVTDPTEAETAAFDAIEAGDIPLLAAISTAADNLHQREITYALALAVLLLAQNNHDQAREYAAHIAERATVIQRRAHVIRLRKLRTHHPDLPGIAEVIDIIEPRTEDG